MEQEAPGGVTVDPNVGTGQPNNELQDASVKASVKEQANSMDMPSRLKELRHEVEAAAGSCQNVMSRRS